MAAPITLVPPSSSREWDAAAEAVPTATPFHSWTFLEHCAQAWGARFEPLLARSDHGTVGVVPLVVEARLGLHWTNSRGALNYLGPAVDPDHLTGTLAALGARDGRRTVRERHEVRLDPTVAPAVRGWKRTIGTTMVVPLRGRTVEDLEHQASRGFRHAPAHAAQHGVLLRPSTDDDLRVALPRLERAVFVRQGKKAPYRDETYWSVWRDFAARGLAHAVTAHVDDIVTGVTLALVRGDVAYEWVSASDGGPSRSSMSVRRELILWAHEAGHREYDMLGGPTPGITEFKRSVGAREKPYVIHERGYRV